MKKLLTCVVILAAWAAKAQNFEGTIKWSMKMDITDPKIKAQMEAAQNHKVTPEEQEKIKQMEAKLNDPQMKAMMDANPQMKAQMESALKMAQGGGAGGFASMIPTGTTLKIKDGNSLSKTEGGVMPMEILFLKDKDQSFVLHRDSKTYNALPTQKKDANKQPGSEGTSKVTKTSETTKILGYTCTRYNVEYTERGRTINEVIWATTEIKNIDWKKFANARSSSGPSLYHEGLEGVPLRVQMTMPQGSMTMEATEIKPESLPASDFSIPADFKETQGMFGK